MSPGSAADRARTLGVIGGGQLGRMFVHAAQRAGFATVTLDADPNSPAGLVSQRHLRARYDDPAALAELARVCAAVTTEFENVPAESLATLAARVRVAPSAQAVQICQHRVREKTFFVEAGVACVPFAAIEGVADIVGVDPRLFPAVLKTATLGYDGKGQLEVADAAELMPAWRALGTPPCVLERRLDLRAECSVIVARADDGQMVHLPLQQNLHRGGILAVTQVPAPDIGADTAAHAVAQACSLAQAMDYVGVLCVEFFVLGDGTLVANEMAPRPHNSGHYSIDACDLSQFDLQVRTLARLPLVMPRQHSAAVMLNLLGDLWTPLEETPGRSQVSSTPSGGLTRSGRSGGAQKQEPPWPALLALPGAHLHLYGKAEPRPGRKIGHLTLTAADAAGARATALEASRLLGLPTF